MVLRGNGARAARELGDRNRLRVREAVRGPFLSSRCSGRQGDTKTRAVRVPLLPFALLAMAGSARAAARLAIDATLGSSRYFEFRRGRGGYRSEFCDGAMGTFELLAQFRGAADQFVRVRYSSHRRGQLFQIFANLARVEVGPGQIGYQVRRFVVIWHAVLSADRCDRGLTDAVVGTGWAGCQ